MRYGSIYKITNLKTNMIYIGQTILDLNTRLNLHFEKIKTRNSKLYSEMKIYSKEYYTIEALESYIPIVELGEKEMYYIHNYDSINNGNNTADSSNGRSVYSDIDTEIVLEMVQENIATIEISKYFNVHPMTIQRLLLGLGIKRYCKINDEELKELWGICLNTDLAEYYGVNEKTIRRHAKKLNLPIKPKHPNYENLKRLSKAN